MLDIYNVQSFTITYSVAMGISAITTLYTGDIPNGGAESESMQNSNIIKYYPVFFWKGFNIYYPKAVKTAFVSLSPQKHRVLLSKSIYLFDREQIISHYCIFNITHEEEVEQFFYVSSSM